MRGAPLSTTKTNTGIIKKLFYGKYLLPLLIIQGVLLYFYFNFPKGTGSLGLVVLGVLYYFSRKVSINAEGEKVRSWQWIAFMVYLLLTVALGMGIFYTTSKSTKPSFDVTGYVNKVVKTVSGKVPLKAREGMIIFKVAKQDNHSFVYHMRHTVYTRTALLHIYQNDLPTLQKSIKAQALQIYCHNRAVRAPLQAGVVVHEKIYGRDDSQPIVEIEIDETSCHAYERR